MIGIKTEDIKMAKGYLIENRVSLVIVKDGQVIIEEVDRGIKPLFKAVLEKAEFIDGGALADKVIGKAAAMLAVKGNIKNIYAKMISESAIQVLNDNGIPVEYELKVPYILNRDKTDSCPVEKMAKYEDDTEMLIEKIKVFLGY
ncbi:DUF1893 domain-containing protein [Clostridium brassicae]|uniref:DUF1893 domain-containing protein n=1 Tax=Clostridium brassicae TaxID=2999072 RepID=A0ABT4D737_9CLOT|nr:DUF1893 domain-containing protein [Clostridium brassicae]MCY6957513.1 DUF1893 domain-containing protein [Clostridium brassicae]